MQSDLLTGTWELTTWEHESGPDFPGGPQPRGRIIYGGDGRMAVVIGSTSRPTAARPGLLERLARRYGRRDGRAFGYSGNYEVSGSEVIHHVEVSTVPEYEGQTFSRTFEIEGPSLRLSYVGPGGKGSMTWRRLD